MRYLYSVLLYLLVPALLLCLWWRSRRNKAYRQRLSERFGWVRLPDGNTPLIWIHAVSVGETLAAVPLVEKLLQAFPSHRILVTTTTPTGAALARVRFGKRVLHAYAPWDLPGAVLRFLGRARPCLLLLMETELWPNTLHYCRDQGCGVVLVNARLSKRSYQGYARFSGLFRPMLENLDVVACQAEADAERFLSLGLPGPAIEVVGNIKYDIYIDGNKRAQAKQLRREYRADIRPVLVAVSTHPGEDEQLLAAFARVREVVADSLLLLVPRHPERVGAVGALCKARGWRVTRRTSGETPGREIDIVLGDTMGELAMLQAVATVAVVGGSMVPHGGHNPLEAAAWGVPLVCGPHMFNFADISRRLVTAGAMVQVSSAELPTTLVELLRDADRRHCMGRAGRQVIGQNAGASQRLLALVTGEMEKRDS